jgi:hypothetical protein
MLRVPDVEFHRIAVFVDGQDAEEPKLWTLPKPGRNSISQVERQVWKSQTLRIGKESDPAAHVEMMDIDLIGRLGFLN